MMDSDGSNLQRLTHLYNPNCPDDSLGRYNGGAGDELDWSPDGQKVIFSAIVGNNTTYPYLESDIYTLEVKQIGSMKKDPV